MARGSFRFHRFASTSVRDVSMAVVLPWVRLHLDTYLSDGLDSLGIEKALRFETGITDPDSVMGTESLNDYSDAGDDPDQPVPLLPTSQQLPTVCRGSKQPADDDLCAWITGPAVTCSDCGQGVAIYRKRVSAGSGWFKYAHIVSEGDASAAPSKTTN